MAKIMKNKIKEWAWVYVALMLVSILSFSLMIFTLTVNDADGTWHGSIAYTGYSELDEGRWLQPYIDKARFWVSPDPISSIVALAIYAAAFILVMELLKIKDKRICAFSGMIFLVSTSVCATLSHRYMSLEFSLAFLFAVLAAWSMMRIEKPALSVIASAPFVTMYMALYQGFLGTTATVVLLYLILCLYRKEELKKIGSLILKCLAGFLVGGTAYYVLWKEELWRLGSEETSYGGADVFTIGGIFKNFFSTVSRPYTAYADYFLNRTLTTTMLPKWFHVALILLFFAASACVIIRIIKGDNIRGVIMAVFTLLVPFATMWFYVITYTVSYMSMHMTINLAASIAYMTAVTSIYMEEILKDKNDLYNKASAALIVLLLIVFYGNYSMVKYDQMAMYMGKNSVNELGSEVIAELLNEGLYDPDTNYCFIGSPTDNPLVFTNDVFEKSNFYAKYGDWGHVASDNRQGWTGFFLHMKGIYLKIADNEVIDAMNEDPRVEAMPVFPQKGSIQQMDNLVVIKISE